MKNENLSFTFFEPKEYTMGATNVIVKCIEELMEEKKQISIALSGGNSPLPIYKELSSLKLNWKNIKFFIVDERCVDSNNLQSNYGNIQKCLFNVITAESFPMVNENKNFEKQAFEYQEKIKSHVDFSNGLPQFDLIILGMGLDGHTASLFPNTEALNNTTDTVVLNKVPQLQTSRITMTYPLLENAKKIILIAPGVEKKKVLNNLKLNQHPIARLIPKINNILN